MSAADGVIRDLQKHADSARAAACRRYFRTGPGEYGEGDRFMGVPVPLVRAVEKRWRSRLEWDDIDRLLSHPVHEVRHLAAIHLGERYKRAKNEEDRQRIFDFYLAHAHCINNWDIVDASAPQVVGAHLLDRGAEKLFSLAQSQSLWERRIAVVATLHFIRQGRLDETFSICRLLLFDPHDLIHKACGWMLREAGKRDPDRLLAFLREHAGAMARVQLRYALEKFPPDVRASFFDS